MNTVLVFALLALPAIPALAADTSSEALRACRDEPDDARRLACYDRVAGHERAPAPAAAVAQTPNPAPAAPKPAPTSPAPAAATGAAASAALPADTFGRERAIAVEEQKRKVEESRAVGEITALVTNIETRMDGLMTITLDNGQVWRQNAPDSKFRLQVEDKVRIQSGSLNSYIMSGPSKRSTRVTRVK